MSTAGLREAGRPIVTAWLEVRDVKTLRIGDAADLMERVGAAIEAERWALQSQLAQAEKERGCEHCSCTCDNCAACGDEQPCTLTRNG